MAKNMSLYLSKLGFKVFTFGNFVDFNHNYECNISGVEFLDNSKYQDWIQTHHIDYLIVSRNPTNIFYLPNIQNVYLWIHDVYPAYEFVQSHRTKFKGVLSLCNWHKKTISDEFSVPLEHIQVTRNAIDVSRFTKDVQKTPLRFIYSSSPDRGLSYLLKLFPKIYEKYPEATLHLYCNRAFIPKNDLEIIMNSDYIHLNKRVNQEEIAIEYLKSDIWFYPTNFTETYCITAVEAQAAGCLCVTSDIGSLKEIVGDRGIVVEGKIAEKETQNKLLEKLFEVLDNVELKNNYTTKAKEWAMKQTYESLAQEWKDNYLI
jgi:glycosyltransferase involved in cell wall biosynthesis